MHYFRRFASQIDTYVMKLIIVALTILLLVYRCTTPNKNSFESKVNLTQKNEEGRRLSSLEGVSPLKYEFRPKTIALKSYRKNSAKIRAYYESNKKYPDFYGVDVSNAENKLIIYIVGDTVKGKKEMSKILDSSDFLIRSCDFSYNYLEKIDNFLTKFFQDKSNQAVIESTTAVNHLFNPVDNCIYVILKTHDQTHIDKFKKGILNDSCIVFKQDLPSSNDGQIVLE